MSKLRRHYQGANIYFITAVTYDRSPILVQNSDLLLTAMRMLEEIDGVEIVAWVIMPDHIHMVMDSGLEDLSRLMHRMKQKFAAQYRSRKRITSGRLWQHRFWDHMIRDDEDLRKHIDYIHYNPVKHGICRSPTDYPHSSFNEFLQNGYYDDEWGTKDEPRFDGAFGE
ncbi:MAG: transposase [candidate division Zixibacteria bacterium]|nr:transposase [candidate division Zixibacteria bacterium]